MTSPRLALTPRHAHGDRVRRLAIAVALALLLAPAHAQDRECSLEGWAEDAIAAWIGRGTIPNGSCYARLITSMDTGRAMRDRVVERFDRMFPRAGYKVVGLDPVNAKLAGVDRPMVGVLYVSMFLPNGATIPVSSAERLITEPDFLVSVKDDRINGAATLEEALPHLDRVYAFIEVPAPTFNNSPPNPFLMQASNLLPRWGVIGDSVEVRPDAAFLSSLETMRVTFQDGTGKVLASEPGSYLGRNPLTAVLVVIEELRRRGERLRPGDLISAGSYMPPIPVTPGMHTEAVYEGVGGTTLRVSARYR
jgi:2-keto-4-pentenoate hydratase